MDAKTKEALERALEWPVRVNRDGAVWHNYDSEALAHLTTMAEDYEKKLADLRLAEADRDIAIERREYAEAELEKVKAELVRLQTVIDCAGTPLMVDVMRERDELKKQVEALYRRDKRLADAYWAEGGKP